jgi:membrane protein
MARQDPVLYNVEPGFAGRAWWYLRSACVAAYEDNCFGIAKGAAYSALLSIFPVLTTITAILVQAKAEAVANILSNWIFEVAPPGTRELLKNHLVSHGQRPVTLLVVAALLSLWAASGVMLSLMEGFQAAYRIPSGRPFWRQRGVAAVLVLCAALPVLGASALMLLGTRAEAEVVRLLGLLPAGAQFTGGVAVLGRVLRYILAFAGIVTGTALLYKVGPNRPIRLVWPGAVVATILWLIGMLVFGWYVRHIANYNVLYGGTGAVIALVVWMYVLSVIALVGCELNAQLEHRRSLRMRLVAVE